MKQHIPTVGRVLLGLLFTGSAIAGLMGKIPPPEGAEAQAFMGALYGAGILMTVKVLELVAGLALLSGFFVPLALLVLAPFIVVITIYHITLDPSGAAVGFICTALWIAAGLGYKEQLMPLLRSK